jgi:hypothetical protein
MNKIVKVLQQAALVVVSVAAIAFIIVLSGVLVKIIVQAFLFGWNLW